MIIVKCPHSNGLQQRWHAAAKPTTCHLLTIAVIRHHIAAALKGNRPNAAHLVTHTSHTHNHACHAGRKATVTGLMFVYLRLPLSFSQEPLSGDNYVLQLFLGGNFY